MLLWQIFKIYNRILANKMIMEMKGKLTEELYAFRAGRATTDLIFEIRYLTEKKQVYGEEFLVVFMHCKNASGNVKSGEICKSSTKIETVTDLFRKVKNTYTRAIHFVKTRSSQHGVRQGSA
jgi:hypothetical protein